MSVYLPFVLLAALLVAAALLLVLPPLFGAGLQRRRRAADVSTDAGQAASALTVLREQLAELEAERAAGTIDAETYARSRDDLEKRALEEGEAAAATVEARPAPRLAIALALAVPVLATAIYLALGEPAGLDPQRVAGQGGFSREQVAQMVGGLEARLQQEPDNVEGWMMLARSYVVLEDFPKAAAAYERLVALVPDNPDILADWADTVAAQHGSVSGPAEAIVSRALEADPNHVKALLLSGTAAFERKDYAAASAQWERILVRIPPQEEAARALRAGINDARAKGGLPPLAEAPAPAAPAAAAGAAEGGSLTLAGRLEIAPALRERAGADDTVFVFVRGGGGGPPLAALRFKAGELPREFSFADAPRMGDGPVPAQLTLTARVSKSGDVGARPGDLEGRVDRVAPDAGGVALVIDTVRE
ncbi:cytochrome c-type biogenesis protein CycH [Azoarcus olearius]|uniref:c-type cytochrome biogenesis protein CcmI n=1 Tax=Azoarcus sp. (strain BH72) TaxID=418699 RepID=UPI0008061BDB|nr:c-type cytochrome biogenesis protein CcmI [Azoarcus olearius]ANQ87087.1 cytochrome c-type biogenesis protein CycH [Azoarcus olearius]